MRHLAAPCRNAVGEAVCGGFILFIYGLACRGTLMTKLSIFDFDSPERRAGRTTKAFRFVWAVFSWTLAFSAVTVATMAFIRWRHMM
jgi:hypothetical protein